jgi:antitoxin HicB
MSDNFVMVIIPLSAEDGGGFVAYAPDLHGCMSDGETREEAVRNLTDAIAEWCEEMKRLGREVPPPGTEMKRAVDDAKRMRSLVTEQKREIEALKCEVEEVRGELEASAEAELFEPQWMGLWSTFPPLLSRGGGRTGDGETSH